MNFSNRGRKTIKKIKAGLPAVMFVVVLFAGVLAIFFSFNRNRQSLPGIDINDLQSFSNIRNVLEQVIGRDRGQDVIVAQSSGSAGGEATSCEKFGVNLLVGPERPDDYASIAEEGMGYFLHVLQGGQEEVGPMASALNSSGLTGVVRFCDADAETGGQDPDCQLRTDVTGNSCASGTQAGSLIVEIADQSSAPFVAAPVNEPSAEHWFGRAPSDLVTFYRCFSERVRDSGFGDKITIAGPTFNVRHSDGTESFKARYRAFVNGGGAEYVDMWTFNFYDRAPGQSGFNIENTLEFLAGEVTDGKPWGIDETGDFGAWPGDFGTLASHVKVLAENEQVSYALFFNALGLDTERWPGLQIKAQGQNHFPDVFAELDDESCKVSEEPLPVNPNSQNIDPETAEYLEVLPHWTLQSCQVEEKNTNGRPSKDGALAVGLDLNPCNDHNNDPNKYPGKLPYGYECANKSENWTAGFAYTGGMRKFPTVRYLASLNSTDDNAYSSPCKSNGVNNITDNLSYLQRNGGQGPFKLWFSSEFPGLGRMIRVSDGTTQNIKVALLGGASGCGILNWEDIETDPLENRDVELRLHPLNLSLIKHSGGPAVSSSDDLSLLQKILALLADLFRGAAIPTNENKSGKLFCKDIPGVPIDRFRTKDTKRMNFVDDNPQGPYEYLFEAPYNYELTKDMVCDAQFHGSLTGLNGGDVIGVTGAGCTLGNIKQISNKELHEKGTAEGIGLVSIDPITGICSSVNLCGINVTCGTSHGDIYRACHPKGSKGVTKVGRNPFLRWERSGYEKTDLIGMAQLIYNTWNLERIKAPYKIIHNVNAGLKTEWGTRVYDLQYPEAAPEHASKDHGALLEQPLLSEVQEWNRKLETRPGQDFDPETLPQEHPLEDNVTYLDPPVLYQTVHVGGYNLAVTTDASGPSGVSKANNNYYYPWLGQVPRMWERMAVFMDNSKNIVVGQAYDTENPVASNPEVDGDLKDLLIGFCGDPCPNGEPIGECDCFARSQDEVDPLEQWLFAPRTSEGLESGAGFATALDVSNVQCVDRPGGSQPPQVPPPDPENCESDPVSEGMTRPATGSISTNYIASSHPGLDIASGFGTNILAAQTGRVVFVRNTQINDSQFKGHGNGGPKGEKCISSKSDPCDWRSLNDAITDNYADWTRLYGNVIGISHGGTTTIYAHLLSGSITVTEGQCVNEGDIIAQMGSTGNSTGSHLHFELRNYQCTNYFDPNCTIDPAGLITRDANGNNIGPPVPPGGNADNLPFCDEVGLGEEFDDDPGYQGTPRPGGIDCIIKTAAETVGVHPAILFAIGKKETQWDCSPTWDIWNTGSRTECTGDPEQTAFASRNRGAWEGRINNGLCPVDVRGITQFSAAGGPTGGFASDGHQGCADTFNGVVSSNLGLMEQCVSALGIELTALTPDDNPFYDEFSSDPRFTRHRVGDAACATAIYARDFAAQRNNNTPLTMEEWSEINLYQGDSEALGLAGNILWDFSTAYHGTCSGVYSVYCELSNQYAFDAIHEGFFDDLECDFSERLSTPTPGQGQNGACPLNKRANQWTQGPSHSRCEYRAIFPNTYEAVDIPSGSDSTIIAPVTTEYQLIAPWDNTYTQCSNSGVDLNNATPYDGGWVIEGTKNGITYRLVHVEPTDENKNSHPLGTVAEGEPFSNMGLFNGQVGADWPQEYNPNFDTTDSCWSRSHLHFNMQGGDADEFISRNCSNSGEPFVSSGWETDANTCCNYPGGASNCNQPIPSN
ncbi:MAG: M23 family metallopeptidase [Candidatus Dojkabacteria bacterium]